MVSICGFQFRVYHWPAFTCIWFTITFLTCLAISLGLGHVYWLFPYISDTGTIHPESCIFAQLLNIGAGFLSVVVYIRFREVEAAIDSGLINVTYKYNTNCLWLGLLSCLGLSIVGNFQQTADYVSFFHFVGALGSFGIGGVYFIMQTVISYQYTLSNYSSKDCNFRLGRKTFYLRLFLSIFFLPLYLVCTVCGVIAARRFTGDNIIYWTPEDGAFELRLIATFSEWILVIFELSYVLSFTKEFKNVKYKGVTINCKFSEVQQS